MGGRCEYKGIIQGNASFLGQPFFFSKFRPHIQNSKIMIAFPSELLLGFADDGHKINYNLLLQLKTEGKLEIIRNARHSPDF